MEFYAGKTKIRIEFSFFLIIAFSLLIGNNNILKLLLFSCFHELGHLFTLYFFKGKAKRINIAFYGIGLRYEHSLSFIQEILFLFSGAAVNIIFYLFKVEQSINGALALINLLPVYPLDGGRIIKRLLNHCFNIDVSDKIFKSVSLICIVFLIACSLINKNISALLISVYIIVFSLNDTSD